MSDDRQEAFPTAGAVTEIPLVGDEVEVTPTPAPSDGTPTGSNRGRVFGIAAAVASVVAVAVLTATVLLGGDENGSPTTVDPEQVAAAITTPPTLSPLEALPPPDDPVTDGGAQPTTSQDRVLSDSVPVPVYPEVPDATLREIVEYDIINAVNLLAADLPRQSETHYELGSGGFVLDVKIVRDPARDRYQITIESRDLLQVAIVDNATGTTYVNPGTGNRIEIPNAEVIEGSTASTINEYFDRLLKGPVRPDTFTPTSTRGRSLVVVPDVGSAREFITNIDGELIPEWQIYAFGPGFEFRPEDRPRLLEYHAYVDDDGNLAQVDGVSMAGNVSQLVQHRITLLDDPTDVDLPVDEPNRPTSSATDPTSP